MSNPLLHRCFDIPFASVRAEHIEPAVHALLAAAQARLDALTSHTGPRTFENTLGALEELAEELGWAMGIVHHLESVATTPELRAANNAVLPPVSTFQTQLLLSEGLWKALGDFARTDEAKALPPLQARLLAKTLDDFRREGANLAPPEKQRLEALNRELDEVTTRFGEHVIDATGAFERWVTDEAELAGLPESAVDAARADAEARGGKGWRFTLHAPSLIPVLTYADSEALRRELYLAYNSRATDGERDNRALLGRILELRREKARLLGYASFADYVLEDRMAKNGATAQRFISALRERTVPFFEREKQELLAYRRGLEGPDAPPLQPWDVGYYAEKLRQSRYDFDEEALRPYFPLPRVLAGMFDIVQRLYGITVTELAVGDPGRPPVWHEDVRYFRIHDADGTYLGSFYADFFPRENKRGGAWMGDFMTGGPRAHGFEPHLGVICGNLTPPLGDKPALLTHDEVETVFHEFGHLLHHCLSRVEVKSLAGTHVAWDFVELPSQIMENWCWERAALDLFARHHETGEPIPEVLLAKLIAAKNFRSASAQMRQLGFASLDLGMHVDYDAQKDGELLAYVRRIMEAHSPVPLRDDYAMVASFTHLFDNPVGYAAGYYSYKWAEVLDADAFTRFQKEGVFSRGAGRAFLDHILSRGDSDEPEVLFRNFMGREPDLEALMQRAGLAPEDATRA